MVKTHSNYLEIHFGSQIESLSSYFFSHPCTSNSNSYCTYQMMGKNHHHCIVDGILSYHLFLLSIYCGKCMILFFVPLFFPFQHKFLLENMLCYPSCVGFFNFNNCNIFVTNCAKVHLPLIGRSSIFEG